MPVEIRRNGVIQFEKVIAKSAIVEWRKKDRIQQKRKTTKAMASSEIMGCKFFFIRVCGIVIREVEFLFSPYACLIVGKRIRSAFISYVFIG